MTRILLTGATGYVGGRLLPKLLDGGHDVRCLVRDPAAKPLPDGAEPVKGDAVSGDGLDDAAAGADVAYYLIHSMEGKGGGFAARDERPPSNFARAARGAGVKRIVYLGGLPSNNGLDSEHLRSRERTAEAPGPRGHLGHACPRRDGARRRTPRRSRCSQALVHRLPVMITPKWVETRSQPIAVDDVTSALAALAERDDVTGEVHLGGADVLTYREMMRGCAEVEGRRRPATFGVPCLSPRLSSYWVVAVHARRRGAGPPARGWPTLRDDRAAAPAVRDQRRPDGLRRRRPGGAGGVISACPGRARGASSPPSSGSCAGGATPTPRPGSSAT